MASDPPIEDSPSPGDDSGVWQRLREHLRQLDSGQSQSSDAADLAKRMSRRAFALREQIQRPQLEGASHTYLAFNKQQERYGVPLGDVAAVESLEHFTSLPNAAGFILGVTPWRGSILSLIDLGRLFGRPESGIADLRVCVIVESSGRRIAIVAHELEEIIQVPESEIAPAPDLPSDIAPEWVIGVHDENRLMLSVSDLMTGIAKLQNAAS